MFARLPLPREISVYTSYADFGVCAVRPAACGPQASARRHRFCIPPVQGGRWKVVRGLGIDPRTYKMLIESAAELEREREAAKCLLQCSG